MTVSFVIPLYNRPDEISELLTSFLSVRRPESGLDYEIVIVEDGSSIPAGLVVSSFRDRLPILYLTQQNTGPSGARNHGASDARGEWLIFLDSDTILPEGYFDALIPVLNDPETGLFGGPDRGHADFSPLQKGISYSMTSLLTTGGIRGQKDGGGSADVFYPRTFNMGIRKTLFDRLGGFDVRMRYGEDLDLSMRATESGAKSRLVPAAWLYHKRRTDFGAFFRQVRHSGEARWALERKHPGTMKPVHWLPFLFSAGLALSVVIPPLLGLYVLYAVLILLDATLSYRYSFEEALNAVTASFVQHLGYGTGFVKGALRGHRNTPD